MGIIRDKLISLDVTKYYHCITRCVRRAYLCGMDPITQQDYDYRKTVIKEHLVLLANTFSIDICAFSIMCNHIHLVLHVNYEKAMSFTDSEVIERWSVLYPLSGSKIKLMIINNVPNKLIKSEIEGCRQKLFSISSFMKCFNQMLAVKFNSEDNCKGRFWEGRFKSIAIPDQENLVKVMAYVDLNPIRAKMVDSPEEHDFSSISERFKKARQELGNISEKNFSESCTENLINDLPQPKYLAPFQSNFLDSSILSIRLSDYLNQINSTWKIIGTNDKNSVWYQSSLLNKLKNY